MAILNGSKIMHTEKRIVEVESGAANLMGTKVVSMNGIYNATNDGYDGYASVMVAVAQPYVTITIVNNSDDEVVAYLYYNGSVICIAIADGTTKEFAVTQGSLLPLESSKDFAGADFSSNAGYCGFVACDSTKTVTLYRP